MTKTMRGCLTAWSQTEGTEEPEKNPGVPQQEEQPDTTESKVIADYNPDIEYEGSEPKNKPVFWEEKEDSSDAKYANMEIP